MNCTCFCLNCTNLARTAHFEWNCATTPWLGLCNILKFFLKFNTFEFQCACSSFSDTNRGNTSRRIKLLLNYYLQYVREALMATPWVIFLRNIMSCLFWLPLLVMQCHNNRLMNFYIKRKENVFQKLSATYTGLEQDFEVQVQEVFKDYVRTKYECSRSSKLAFTAHARVHRKPKKPKTSYFMACQEFSCRIFSKLSLKSFFKLFLHCLLL